MGGFAHKGAVSKAESELPPGLFRPPAHARAAARWRAATRQGECAGECIGARRGAGARSVDLASHGGHTRGSPLTRLHRSGLLRAPRSQDVKMYAYYVVHAAEACVSAAAEAEAAGAAAVAAATLTSNGWHSRVAYCTRGQQHPHGPTRDSGVQPQSRPSHNPHAQSTRPEEPDLPLPASPSPHIPNACARIPSQSHLRTSATSAHTIASAPYLGSTVERSAGQRLPDAILSAVAGLVDHQWQRSLRPKGTLFCSSSTCTQRCRTTLPTRRGLVARSLLCVPG